MKKILFVNNSLNIGGSEIGLVNLCNKIDLDRYSLTLIILSEESELETRLNKRIEVIHIRNSFSSTLTFLRNKAKEAKFPGNFLFQLMSKSYAKFCYLTHLYPFRKRTEKYDVAFSFNQGIVPIYTLKYVNALKKTAVYQQGEIEDFNYFSNIYKQFNNILFVSNSIMDEIGDLFPQFKDKFSSVKNVIDIESIKKLAEKKVDIQTHGIKIVTASRLSEEKGVLLAIEVGAVLKDLGTDFTWIIVGDGPQKNDIKQSIIKHHLENNFILTGSQTNPYVYINIADIYVQSSYYESFGLAILEAQILNKIVVSTNTYGAKGLIINEETGILCEIDAHKIANIIVTVNKDDDLKKRITECLKKKDFKKINNETLAVYMNLFES